MNKQFWLALLACGALVGLGGCSEGDDTTITIDAPDNSVVDNSDNSTNNSGGGDTGGDTGGGDEPPPDAECPSGTTDLGGGVCELPATIAEDMTLTSDFDYLMTGRVTVGNGNGELGDDGNLADGTAVQNVTLTIEAGTQILGDTGTFANMIITRGSKLMAMGTADAPIVFSSDDEGFDGAGEWGGLIMHGYAPHNECEEGGSVCNIDSEGESGFAGGYDPDDSSGVLQYVVVAEGGYEFAPGDEINGISLIGVGRGTTMEYIQVEGNSDDGIEFYGGTVNVKYGVFTNNLDDSVDWDEGYQGNLQYIIVKQSRNGGGEAFEMDTQGTDLFLSKPTVSNLTIIADKQDEDANYILRFKAGSGGFFHNTVVTVADGNNTPLNQCVEVNGSDSEALVGSALVLNNWIQDCAEGAGDQGALSGSNVDLDNGTIFAVPAELNANGASNAPEAILDEALDWAAINDAFPESVADVDFLEPTRFIGAVNPTTNDAWWAGWTIEGSVGNPEVPEASCPTGTDDLGSGVCLLPPTISSDLTLNGGVEYLMEGRVTVGNGNGELGDDGNLADGSSVRNVTLTIEPGVQIKGKAGTFANMIITRGSKIMAMGTKSAPIVFSSDDDGISGAGEWGGLILHGYGPHNECTPGAAVCNIDSEGESGFAGGYDPTDSSGVLRYVVVAEGGYEFAPGDEINGISLIGVGSGTTMEYIQVEGNSDDGIEFYGGTVSLKYGVFTNNLDDSVDWDEGYQGNLQYVIVKQSRDGGGEAFEMDTQGTDLFDSKPTIVNLTIIADKQAEDSNYIMRFKAGSGGFFHNTVVTVADGNATPLNQCAEVDGSDSEALVGTALVFNNWIQDCAEGAGNYGSLTDTNVSLDNGTIIATDAALDGILASQAPEAAGLDPIDWEALGGALAVPGSDAEDPAAFDPSFFDATTFMGAVNPDGSDPWWAGWTVSGSL